jgi:hypothetical protein
MSDENTDSAAPPPAPAAPPPPQEADAVVWRQRAEDAERELALRRAIQGVDWFEPEDAYRLLAQHAARDAEGRWQISLPSKDGRTSSAQSLSPADAARELAARKPHWIRARVIGGTGAGGGEGGLAAHSAGISYAELLRPENRDKLREYIHERPEDLERLRQSHFRR